MDTKKLLTNIRTELNKHKDYVYKEGSVRFFKGTIHSIGVRTSIVRRIARDFFPKNTSKKDLFRIAEALLDKRMFEETIIAFAWMRKIEKQLVKADFPLFERWLKTYADNWAFVDDFCTHAFGTLLTNNPGLMPKVKKWRTSKNRWQRRASAVILINAMMKREKIFLPHVFETADDLLLDQDDLVQKGYGWMLKVASNTYRAEVFNFVLARRDVMPRTALRYAIEKYPKEMRREAMKKLD